ncbi:DUF4183 domain-containing protein [Marinicrinis sediminis]|uniref:DUF4183 domain-containing protein n=1 Tax=Marinicrinis sediminis TaxID=1652465 RepID=A0ABW5R6V2_9BACL
MSTKKISSRYAVEAKTFTYIAISDGEKMRYTSEDGLPGHRTIYSPKQMTLINLFVNAVLQPSSLYHIQRGQLLLLSDEPPLAGSSIILQFVACSVVRIRPSKRSKRRPSRKKPRIPYETEEE